MSTAFESTRSEQVADTNVQGRLYRSRDEKIVAGVSGGLGEYFAIDPVWFRIGFIVLALGGGSGILVYLLMWLIVPESPEGHVASGGSRGTINGAAVIGIVFIFIGTIALVNTLAPWLGQYLWPVIFVVGGLALLLGGVDRDRH
ncbi:MAG TPA: PspC domain-containing protein [Acidimicrobiia bacterium]|nr:PspC domain-containing protein [Acidimicrobiia bacterium]